MQVTYLAVGGLSPREANTNFAQRVTMAPGTVDVTVLVPRETPVSLKIPPNVSVRRAALPTLIGFYLDAARCLLAGFGREADVVVTDRSAVAIVAWVSRRVVGYLWAVDLWDVPHKELVADYAERRGLRGRARRIVSTAKVRAFRHILHRADLVLASVVPAGLRRYKVDPSRLRFFSNAIDLSVVATGASSDRVPMSICFVTSNFLPDRGLDVLVKAIKRLSRDYSLDPQVTLVGKLPQAQRKQIEHSSVGHRFHITGECDLDVAHEIMRRSEVGILPGQSNDDLDNIYPIKIYEYMALGCVPVVSDLPGLRSALDDGSAGVLVEPGNAEALAAGLERVLSDTEIPGESSSCGRGLRQALRRASED